MKKFLLINVALLMLGGMGYSQENTTEPMLIKNFYSQRISPSGEWIASRTANSEILNQYTGELYEYSEASLGLGNAIADNGMAVGSLTDYSYVMYKGEGFTPETLQKANFASFNGITRDGTRAVGYYNLGSGKVFIVPFYCDIAEDGTFSEPVTLPYPEKDLIGQTPQYVTAISVSDDGKTIVGMVTDNRGWYDYPIMYQEDENGEWSYSYPFISLYNPDHIEMPENPFLNEPPYPEPTDFMDPESREIFEEEQAGAAMGWNDWPNPTEFMTLEQYEEYSEAVDTYNDWYFGTEAARNNYINAYHDIIRTSAQFGANEVIVSPSGKTIAAGGSIEKNNQQSSSKIFLHAVNEDSTTSLQGLVNDMYPTQIMDDGTIIAANGILNYSGQIILPNSYILLPEADEFITMEEYFSTSNPYIYDWIQNEIPQAAGVISVSADWNVISGGILVYNLASYTGEEDYLYLSYIFSNGESGVKVIDKEDNIINADLFRVYNLQGVNVLNTTNQAEVNTLPSGLYIINGKKVMIK